MNTLKVGDKVPDFTVQDQDGNDRYTTEVIASEMQFLDSKGSSNISDQGVSRTEPEVADENIEDEDIPF